MLCISCISLFFFFKQKTAYEMRISDWSSDVCSSDLAGALTMTLASRTIDMRATATLSPVRKGKRRLLESCALAAGMVALAYGAPAMAQVAGTGTIVSGGGTPTGVSGTPTTTTVTPAQNGHKWVPKTGHTTGRE